jgi:hypothetical protein
MLADSSASCPHCGVARVASTECARCGVIYAKARLPAAHAAPRPDGVTPPLPLAHRDEPSAAWTGSLEDAHVELVARVLVPPIALAGAWLVVSSAAGHMLVRTFLSMWVHELGHAVSAWMCGFGAFPGPWRTPVSGERMLLVTAAVLAAFGWVAFRGWRERRWTAMAIGLAGIALHALCRSLPARSAQALVTFCGDGGNLVLGALLMATFQSVPGTWAHRGALRWGFVVIGAASVADACHTWMRARADPGEIPLGEIEGVGLSDASKLVDVYGWTYTELIGRYVTLGAACLVAIAATYVAGVLRARARAHP